MRKFIIITACICVVIATKPVEQPPNVIFILADDLGFNDVGFHGSSQIPTPNLDALAYSGIILNNYYVQPICTPSRSALMTGKHPIHLGIQHSVLYGAEPRGLSLTETLMPQYFKQLGYTTRIVGKWHLGSWKLEYTPTFRGFDSHLGCWTGHQDYNDHTASEKPGWGLDMRNNTEVAYNLHGKYTTTIITDEAVRLIETQERNIPLFLYVAHNAVHSGNPYNPLPAPDKTIEKIQNIADYDRRRFAGMLTELDNSVGKIVEALSKANMLENSIIVFSSDNGGPAAGFNLNAASNWPLRGVKNTLWEGGVRAAGFLWSPLIESPKRVSNQMMHITDWLPSLYAAAGGNASIFSGIDGMNMWEALSKDEPSPRVEILHNIDEVEGNSALTSGGWKIVRGTTYNGEWDSWYGPTGRDGIYNISAVLSSLSGEALRKIGLLPSKSKIVALRLQADVQCSDEPPVTCNPIVNDCLFNIVTDPCEKRNLASQYPDKLEELRQRLSVWNSTLIPHKNLPLDLNGDPKYWNYVWTNFGDYVTSDSPENIHVDMI